MLALSAFPIDGLIFLVVVLKLAFFIAVSYFFVEFKWPGYDPFFLLFHSVIVTGATMLLPAVCPCEC